jgi:hypothetical protein
VHHVNRLSEIGLIAIFVCGWVFMIFFQVRLYPFKTSSCVSVVEILTAVPPDVKYKDVRPAVDYATQDCQ